VIINTPFDDSIKIREDLVDFVRNISDDADLLRVSNAGKDASDFA
jgi:hypothetical protein